MRNGAKALIVILMLLSSYAAAIVYGPTMTADAAISGDFGYSTINDGAEIEITGYLGSATALTVPSEINGLPVTSIGMGTFAQMSFLESIAIPASVTTIGDYAFQSCTSLRSMVIPASVTYVGNYTFSECTSLTSITVPGGITGIGNYAFWACTSLASISIPDNVTGIGDGAFSGCSALTSVDVPDGVISIGNFTFSSCTSLNSITLGRNVTGIGYYAFQLCPSLTSIAVDSDNQNYTSTDGVLYSKDQTVLDQYPEGKVGTFVIPESVTSLGYNAFQYSNALTSVTIGRNVTIMGTYAFDDCAGLVSFVVDVDNPLYASADGVLYDKGLTTLIKYPAAKAGAFTVPDTVINIDSRSFDGCGLLTSVVISSNVTSIGYDAFSDCASLTSVTISDSVATIGSQAFGGCTSLTSISVDTNNQNYSSADGVLYTKDQSTLVQYPAGKIGPFTIPENVMTIGDSAFYNCTSLTAVTIPGSVTTIGSNAFQACTSMTSLLISEGLISIGTGSFADCLALTSVTIPDSVILIGGSAFVNCISLTSVTVGKGVDSISSYAFYGCTALTSFAMSSGIISIGDDAFYGCTSLTSLTIPETVTSIGNNAFYFCTNLTSITIPNGVTAIAEGTFGYGLSLTSVNIGAGVTAINFTAFYDCIALTSIALPDGLTLIGSNAFYNCTALTSITIPDSVTVVGDAAFMRCTALASVTIGSGVDTIGNYTFFRCPSLTSITFLGLTAPTYVGEDWITDTGAGITGHAYAASDFPAIGSTYYGLTMGSVIGSGPSTFLLQDTYPVVAAVAAGSGLAVLTAFFVSKASGTVTVATAPAPNGTIGRPRWKKLVDLLNGGVEEVVKNRVFKKIEGHELESTEPVLRPSVFAGLSWWELGVVLFSSILLGMAFMVANKVDLGSPFIWPLYILVAGLAIVLHELAHRYVARRTGAVAEYRFWLLGAITMFITAIPLGVVYSAPSRLGIKDEDKMDKRQQGLIYIAGPIMSFVVFLAFLAVVPLGGLAATIGTLGATMNLLTATYAMMPFKTLDGIKVFGWSKKIWAALFFPMLAIYIALVTFIL